MNVLIIMGHPRKDSFSGAIAEAYKEGATSIGLNVRQLNLIDHNFNPNVITVSPRHQAAEEIVVQAQQQIIWADHLVFIYPTWWGSMPALLKAFLDRTFTPGFAFEELEENQSWHKLLTGRSAQLITTMDTPLWVYRWIYKNPGHHAIGTATLKFCGISPVRTLSFSPIKYSSEGQRAEWLQKVKEEAVKLKGGVLSPWEKFLNRTLAWLRAIRLQFYPMTWIAYAAGAYAAAQAGHGFNTIVFWLGYLWLFLLEVGTVLSNDYFDYESDKRNKYFSPFTGGSRVLLDKTLAPGDLLRGVWVTLILSLAALLLLATIIPADGPATWGLILTMYVLALGYTVPPLKLSYRGLGELDVGITHSLMVILCGYHIQGGNILDPVPWLLGLPLFLAIFPSIILAGVPDHDADKAVGKKTLAVRLGIKTAVRWALFFTVVSALTALLWYWLDVVPGAYGWAVFAVVPHAVFLCVSLFRYQQQESPAPLINGLMINSLTYVIWFGIIPFFQL
jgi:1,4-dihydroxy-2-naphthoate octaprenyltransferase